MFSAQRAAKREAVTADKFSGLDVNLYQNAFDRIELRGRVEYLIDPVDKNIPDGVEFNRFVKIDNGRIVFYNDAAHDKIPRNGRQQVFLLFFPRRAFYQFPEGVDYRLIDFIFLRTG